HSEATNWVKAASAANAGDGIPSAAAIAIRIAAIAPVRKAATPVAPTRPRSMRGGVFGLFGRSIRQFVDIGNADRRQNEDRVNDGLPHHADLGIGALAG